MKFLMVVMHKTDVKKLSPWILRRILSGEGIIITHKGEDLCAVIPMELLNLLEGLQLESLEEEDAIAADEIKRIISSISQNNR